MVRFLKRTERDRITVIALLLTWLATSGQNAWADSSEKLGDLVEHVAPQIATPAAGIAPYNTGFVPVTMNKEEEKKKCARGVVSTEIAAPPEVIWALLTDFPRYPKIFKRLDGCQITKREGDHVFVASYLKGQLFVKERCQHVVNDLSGAPNILRWHAIDGNFKSLDGCWDISTLQKDRTLLTYTLEVDAGPIIPGALVGFILHSVQKEVLGEVKKCAEHDYNESERKRNASAQTL